VLLSAFTTTASIRIPNIHPTSSSHIDAKRIRKQTQHYFFLSLPLHIFYISAQIGALSPTSKNYKNQSNFRKISTITIIIRSTMPSAPLTYICPFIE